MVLSENNAPYQKFSAALHVAIAANKVDVDITEVQSGQSVNADVIVAVGMKAMESALAGSNAPVLGAMIHKAGYEALLEKAGKKRSGAASAIYLNQPWERQQDFIRAVLPDRRRIGLLHSPDTHLELEGLKESFATRGLTLIAQSLVSSESLYASLDELLGKTEVLLAVPDSAIYNPGSIRNILLTSYRHKIPLIGVSQSYVNAGALGAVFSTPEHIAEQAGSAVVYLYKNKRLPEPQYPASYSVILNHQVARSLGINLPSQEEIRERMDNTRREVR